MQIVNGGQTTASIFNAKKDKKINADLSRVFVQMKLSVIGSSENMDEIVPKNLSIRKHTKQNTSC